MKVLNLYSGLGGNRKLWEDVEVTAVERDEETARVYQDYFPNDTIVIGDAHQYLLDHYKEFDFIWSSPPCPTHSKLNFFLVPNGHRDLEYPDMGLYQEILLLKHWFKGLYVIENVESYYNPLLPPTKKIDRHYFWSNIKLGNFKPSKTTQIKASSDKELQELYGFDLNGYNLKDSRKAVRNCVHPETGLYILERARGIVRKSNTKQMNLL